MSFRSLQVLAAALVVTAPAAVLPAAALAKGVTVYAGPPSFAALHAVNAQADALAFYPKQATVHVGETVTWQFHGFHTATFPGTMTPYPFVVPLGTSAQPATNDAAGKPFWWGGKAPVLSISPMSVQPQGGGAISSAADVRSSGLLRILTAGPTSQPPAPYTLTFTKPGLYRYLCAVHPGMKGVIRVLPKKKAKAPSPAAQTAKELRQTVTDLTALNAELPPNSLEVFVGAGKNASGAEIAAFFPKSLTVPVGSTVTFQNNDETDIHTVTFGPADLRTQIEKSFAAPQGMDVLINPLGAFASEPPGAPLTYDGTNHGNGYFGSGILQPPGAPAAAGPSAFAVTFTKPGTYDYECVIHAGMDGTIVVK